MPTTSCIGLQLISDAQRCLTQTSTLVNSNRHPCHPSKPSSVGWSASYLLQGLLPSTIKRRYTTRTLCRGFSTVRLEKPAQELLKPHCLTNPVICSYFNLSCSYFSNITYFSSLCNGFALTIWLTMNVYIFITYMYRPYIL